MKQVEEDLFVFKFFDFGHQLAIAWHTKDGKRKAIRIPIPDEAYDSMREAVSKVESDITL